MHRLLTYIALFIVGALVFAVTAGLVIYAMFQSHVGLRTAELEQQMRDRGEPVTIDELVAYYPAVPDAENAAIPYGRAGDLLFELDPEGAKAKAIVDAGQQWDRSAPLAEDLRLDVQVYADRVAPIWPDLREAALRPLACYPINQREGMGMEMPHLPMLRSLSRAISVVSLDAALDGRAEVVVECQQLLNHLAQSLTAEPVLISQIYRSAILSAAAHDFVRDVSIVSIPDSDLAALQSIFRTTGNTESFTRAIAGERCQLAALFKLAGSGEAVFDNAEANEIGELSSFVGVSLFMAYQRLLLYEYTERVMTPPDRSYAERIREARAVATEVDEANWTQGALQILFFLSDRTVSIFARPAAELRMMDSVAAVERFRLETGALPASLDDLVPAYLPEVPTDPFDDKPIRYRKQESGYLVYSVSLNQQDDGGIKSANDGDWILRVVR